MAFPFDLPSLSRGFADLSAGARATGLEVAAVAARALSDLLGCEVTVRGRAVPARPASRAAVARVAIELSALPGLAVLEVEPALVVALVDRLAGGAGAKGVATALTPVESAALELLTLIAVDGACRVGRIEELLAPRLARSAADATGALAVELDVTAGQTLGRGRLLVPAAAVRALAGPASIDGAAAGLRLSASVRGGAVALTTDELDALSPGDVLVVEAAREVRAVVLPGGLRAVGRADDDGFHVEEIAMTERHSQLPVTLEIELGRIDVTLGDLTRLEPGATLPLGLDRRGLVTLRAGERVIARGELVDVEGAVGVRILSLEVAT
jgi:type III secretion protein Q